MRGPFDPISGLVALNDMSYRTLLRATIAANNWDGTIPGAYAIWDILFSGTGIGILIQDYGDMTTDLALTGPIPDPVTTALFANGYMNLVPAGVLVRNYLVPVIPDTPYFGLDVENAYIAGLDVGAFGKSV